MHGRLGLLALGGDVVHQVPGYIPEVAGSGCSPFGANPVPQLAEHDAQQHQAGADDEVHQLASLPKRATLWAMDMAAVEQISASASDASGQAIASSFLTR